MSMRNAGELLERDAELGQLDAVLDGLRDAGALLVIEGAAGIGKTRLLGELRARARERGIRTGAARGTELEQPFAFGAVRQLLGPLAVGASFAGAASHARPLFDGSADGLDAAPDALFGRLHALFWLCVELTADGPLVLLLDDLQWADAGSLAFAAFLRSRLADVPVLLAVATRPVAAPPPALADVVADPAARVLRPRPLSSDAVTRWARRQLDDDPEPGFVAACHDATGGNPLLLRELLAEAAAEGLRPDAAGADRLSSLTLRGVASVVLLRLARLSPAAQDLARAVAILGDETTPAEAGALAGRTEGEARAAAAELIRADLLRDAEPLAYSHPIVRATVLDDLPAVTRAGRHREAAALLRAAGAPAERVASQLLAAGGAASADDVATLHGAAQGAVTLGDPAGAVEYLRAALPATTGEARAELLLELADAEGRSGDAAALDHLQEVLATAEEPERRARAAVHLGRVLNFAGEPDRAVDVLESTESELPGGSPAADAVATELLGAAHITRSAARRLAGRLRRLQEPAAVPRTPFERMALVALGFAQTIDGRGTAAEAERLARRALESGGVLTDPLHGGQVVVMGGLVLTCAGHHEDAVAFFTDGLSTARASGSVTAVAAFCSMRCLPLLRLGRLADAEADAREALDIAHEVPTAGTLGHCALGVAGLAVLERGAPLDEVDAVLAHRGVDVDLDILPASLVLIARGELELARGRTDAALEHFQACDSADPNWGRDSPTLVPWRSGVVRALLARGASGDAREAARLAQEQLALARHFGARPPLGAALRVAALTAGAEERRALLQEAIDVLRGAEAPLELARAQADLGADLRRAGERTAARELLETALVAATAAGAGRLADAVREELGALGLRPTRAVALGRELTPSERRVAQMAADGLTNREIAQRLFVTEKTVETHLSAAYRKLGVRTRRQLPHALGR